MKIERYSAEIIKGLHCQLILLDVELTFDFYVIFANKT